MEGSEKIDLIIVLGTSGMLLLALFIIVFVVAYQRRLFAKQKELIEIDMRVQKELMEAVILTKEKEQKRMAQELHDGIGSALTALKMSLIQMTLDKDDKTRINSDIKAISTDVRRLSNELMPSVLEDMGLQKAISNLTSHLSLSSPILFIHDAKKTVDDLFNEQGELALFRVVQEILNNIVKYANATNVNVTEEREGSIYFLDIVDNGDGYIPSEADLAKPGSLGLKNIKSRIQQINGTITYKPMVPKGTMVTIEIPIHEKH
jgi:signal transduction histidine kinase